MIRKSLFALILGFSFAAAAQARDADQANLEKSRQILKKIEEGKTPQAGAEARYYSGSCVVIGGMTAPEAPSHAIFGLKTENGKLLTTWWVSYGSKEDDYRAIPKEQLEQRYTLHERNSADQGNRLYVHLNDEPPLFYYASADAADPAKIHVAGSHIGLVFCELTAL